MSIRYIQSNSHKLDFDNIIKFLLDLTVVQLDDVKPYEEGKYYTKGEFIYLKENGLHKVYRCIVDKSSDTFIPIEWENVMDTYDSEIKNVSNIKIREEVVILDDANKDNIMIPEYQSGSVNTIYNEKEMYIEGYDFTVDKEGKITFKPDVNVEIGDRLIIEIRESIGLPDRLILLSSNGSNYEVGVISDDMYIIETDLKYSKPEVFIKDIVTEEIYRIYMIDYDLYYEVTEIYTHKTDIRIIDMDNIEYKLEMVNGELMFSVKE